MANISAGVYSKIIDLSSYVQQVPGTIAFICGLTEKGPDNTLQFISSRSELILKFGEPNINSYGSSFSQGLYEAYNYLGESGALYFLRCLPSDASYSNIRLNAIFDPASSDSVDLQIDYLDSLNSIDDIETALEESGTSHPLCILYPVGRGQYYNSISVRLTEHYNPLHFDILILDIYQKQSDGTETIIESFEVSFNPNRTATDGSSLYIEDVLETYSNVLRAKVGQSGFDLVAKEYDKEIGNVSVVLTDGSASISDDKQDFSDWQDSDESGYASYMVIAKDGRGSEIYGWLGASFGTYNDGIHVFNGRNLSTAEQSWLGDVDEFDVTSEITYQIRKSNISFSDVFSSSAVPLRKGGDGSIFNSDGSVNSSVATQILSQGYAGSIDANVLDTDSIYFSLVFDAGYPTDVKSQIVALAQTRGDCIAICDNGDNSSPDAAINKRRTYHTYNTYYAALYEPYNKVYDIWTGKDIWVSPIYHMSYLLPRNDMVAELWYAAAGFNRTTISTIKEMRFNPRLGQRDQLYLNQLNPIVKFSSGYVVWSQLTTQTKASAMQDLNIARLVLYIQRALSLYAQNFVFELNDQTTWGQVSNDVMEFLQNVKKRRGLYNYSVEVGATEYELKTRTFHVNVTLEPTRATKAIYLNFFIK